MGLFQMIGQYPMCLGFFGFSGGFEQVGVKFTIFRRSGCEFDRMCAGLESLFTLAHEVEIICKFVPAVGIVWIYRQCLFQQFVSLFVIFLLREFVGLVEKRDHL